ncbi:hypothetical protein FRC00_002533 [Tulasnella sp. 408]|nr:hypothetical protein FRC00_002533 [Tulasnella sp. 408]
MDAPQLIFHDNFQFHDGNIIVSASGSRDGRPSSTVETVYFRLHKSVLAIYSTTFADMLSMPQGDADAGQAIVPLQDPLDHVIKLLTAIYYGGSVPQQPLSRAKWDFLVPVLMLTDKYDMGPLATNLLPSLLEDWPTALEQWDAAETHTRSIIQVTVNRRKKNRSLPSPNDVLPEPAMAIKFGQAHPAARNVLPAAFYHLSRLSHVVPEGFFTFLREEARRFPEYSLLSGADWLRIVRGQAKIRQWLHDFATHRNYFGWPPSCPRRKYQLTEDGIDDESDEEGTPDPCRARDWWHARVKPLILELGAKMAVDVLTEIETVRDIVQKRPILIGDDDICDDCLISFRTELGDSRPKFWAELPDFFDLGDYPNWGKS